MLFTPTRKATAKTVTRWLLEGVFTFLTVAFVYHIVVFWPSAKYTCTKLVEDRPVLDRVCVARALVVLPAVTWKSANIQYQRDFSKGVQ
jgi:hypothetical protein